MPALPRPDGDPDAYRPGGTPLPRPAGDPDAYRPDAPADTAPQPRLDPAGDPDRYRPGAGGVDDVDLVRPLPRLPGEPADEELPVATWLVGLLGVFGFLALVTLAIRLAGG